MIRTNRIGLKENKRLPMHVGFGTAELIDRNASGSFCLGQYADLVNTGTKPDWYVAKANAMILKPKLEFEETAGWSSVVIFIDNDFVAIDELRTTAEKIEYIRDAFGISVSHLAKTLKTSRPSVYSWLDGEEPRVQTIDRIQEIYDIAKKWKTLNPYHFSLAVFLQQPVVKSTSLLESLERDDLDSDEIDKCLNAILELMHSKKARMDKVKQRTERFQSNNEDIERNRRDLTGTVSSVD